MATNTIAPLTAHEIMQITPYLDAVAPASGDYGDRGRHACVLRKNGEFFAVEHIGDSWVLLEPFSEHAPTVDNVKGAIRTYREAPFHLVIHYLYRDVSNYKTGSMARIGPFRPNAAGRQALGVILTCLSDSQGFIPSELGMEDLQPGMVGGFKESEDTAFHEVIALGLVDASSMDGGSGHTGSIHTGSMDTRVTKAVIPMEQALSCAREWMAQGREWNVEAAYARLRD